MIRAVSVSLASAALHRIRVGPLPCLSHWDREGGLVPYPRFLKHLSRTAEKEEPQLEWVQSVAGEMVRVGAAGKTAGAAKRRKDGGQNRAERPGWLYPKERGGHDDAPPNVRLPWGSLTLGTRA